MGLKSSLATLAATGEIPVFAVVGAGHRSALHRLRNVDGIRVVASPRHAAVMLVAGSLTAAATESVSRVHDQMAGPRVTVGWGHAEPTAVPLAVNIDGGVSEVVEAIRRSFRDVVSGALPPEGPLLPDVDPVEWRGVGPYGHGGAGMTGGTPYGRPLALRAPDPDGLELDQLPVTIGPWFAGFPPGLALRVSLQGDVAQNVEVVNTSFVPPGTDGPFHRALSEPTPIRDLELARARHHLEWMADALMLAGVDRLALRADRLAEAIEPGDTEAVEQLASSARRSLLQLMTLGGIGVLPSDIDLTGLGPVARAAGLPADLRETQPSYRDIGFQTITHNAGDAWARFEQRAAEAAQAVGLASRADTRSAFGDGEVEAPDGVLREGASTPADALLAMLDRVLSGAEWGDLVATVQSLDLHMESVSIRDQAR